MGEIAIRGKTFKNSIAACEYYGVNYNTYLCRRYSYGLSVEEALTRKLKDTTFIVGDQKFKSRKDACIFYNLNQSTVRLRLEKGLTIDEAFGRTKRSTDCTGKIYKITNKVNGKIYIGLTTQPLKIRFDCHKRDALRGSNTKFHKAIRKYGSSNFKIKLIKETECRNKLNALEIKYIRKYNSIKRGYNTATGGSHTGLRHGKEIEYEGIKFISYKALADHLGIKEVTVRGRLRNGRPVGDPVNKDIVVKNKRFSSIAEACRHFGVGITTAHYRLKNGWSLEDTFTKKKRSNNGRLLGE